MLIWDNYSKEGSWEVRTVRPIKKCIKTKAVEKRKSL